VHSSRCIIVLFHVMLSFGNHICRHFVDVYGYVELFAAKEFKSLVALIIFLFAESLLHSKITSLVFHVYSLFSLKIMASETCLLTW
jgi:hypothetical protein